MAQQKKRQGADYEGSAEAKRRASVVLEVLSGMRTPPEASEVIGITLPRYYTLENVAIQGLVKALEHRGPGGPRGPRPETQLKLLAEERDRLVRELQRAQALVRISQRAVGVPSAEKQRKARNKKRKAAGKKKARRPTVRARKAVARLRQGAESNGKKPAEGVIEATEAAEKKRA